MATFPQVRRSRPDCRVEPAFRSSVRRQRLAGRRRQGNRMNSGELLRENAALRERLSRLSQAGRRINESLDESLDFDTVLQEVSGLLDRPKANRPSPVGRLP